MKRNKKKQLHCDEYLVDASLFSSNKTFHFLSNELSFAFSKACKCIERVICKNVYLEQPHGFSVLSDTAVFAYKVDNVYAPESDSGIRYDDKELNIDWGLTEEEVQLSQKDKNLSLFKDFDSPFKF